MLGIAVGIFFGEMVGWVKIVGDIFIKLLQITVIPYISFSLITGLGELNYEVVRRLALKGGHSASGVGHRHCHRGVDAAFVSCLAVGLVF